MTVETYELTQVLKTHKGETKTLELQMPKARSFIKHGPIMKTVMSGLPGDRKEENSFNYEALIGFLADMTGHDALLLENMTAYDLERLGFVVWGMLSIRPKMPS